jgi:hypothetical protein
MESWKAKSKRQKMTKEKKRGVLSRKEETKEARQRMRSSWV